MLLIGHSSMIGPWYAQHASLASGAAQWRRSVAHLSGAAQCDIVIAIYRISLSFAGNELGNDPTARKQLRWRRCLDLICTSGQRRTNTLVARTYARWPFRASGVLDPLARRVKKAAGPAVNVEACARSHARTHMHSHCILTERILIFTPSVANFMQLSY